MPAAATNSIGAARWLTSMSNNSALYRTSLATDLRPLSALLWQRGIAHRIAEQSGEQVLRLANEEQRDDAKALLDRWLSGEIKVSLRPPSERSGAAQGLSALLKTVSAAPVTALMIALSVAGFFLVFLGGPVGWVATLTFLPFDVQGGQLVFGAQDGQLWRLVTPVFLHFGWLHITFNALWCWELGRRIETLLGSMNLFGLFLVIAAVSNTAQSQVSGPVLFGGLSGVVYGWLGFAWVAGRINPHWRALVPATPVMLFMVGWLVVCVFGLVDVLGFSVANAAHVGGLLSGAGLGALLALLHRRRV